MEKNKHWGASLLNLDEKILQASGERDIMEREENISILEAGRQWINAFKMPMKNLKL